MSTVDYSANVVSRQVQDGTNGFISIGEKRKPKNGEFVEWQGNIWECLNESIWQIPVTGPQSDGYEIMVKEDDLKPVEPWREAVVGDLVRLTGKGFSGKEKELYEGSIQKVTRLAAPKGRYVHFKDDRGLERGGLFNEKSRFEVMERVETAAPSIEEVVAIPFKQQEPHWYL